MIKLPLDEATLQKFREIAERIEICDLEGRIVGYYEPSRYAGHVMPEFDEAEHERRMQEFHATGKGYTISQVLEHLQKLEEK